MPFLLRSISSRLFQGDPFEQAAAASDEESAASGGYGGAFLQEEHATTPLQARMLDKNNVPGGACESPRSVLEPLVSVVQHARATASSCLGRFLCSPCSTKDEGCIWDEWDDGSPFRVLVNTVEGTGEPASMLSSAQSQCETASTPACTQSQHVPDACYQSWQRQLSDSSQDTKHEDEDEEFDMVQSIFSPASRRFSNPSKTMSVEVRMTSHDSIFSAASSESSFCSSDTPAEDFLRSCFLCNCTLAHDQDIYMYRGDRAFCSTECRDRQIFLDEGIETCFGAANWYSDL